MLQSRGNTNMASSNLADVPVVPQSLPDAAAEGFYSINYYLMPEFIYYYHPLN